MADIEPYLIQIEGALASIRRAVAPPVELRPQTGGELQIALDTAPAGASIRLRPNAEYLGNFEIRQRPLEQPITVTTDRPFDPGRIQPDEPDLAVLRSPNTLAALTALPGSSNYNWLGMGFFGNVRGEGDIVRIGLGTESDPATLPHHMTFDRVWMRGDPAIGQKRGIALNGNWLAVLNSDIRGIRRSGQDNQALALWNSQGNLAIVNNHLESGGEIILLGGERSAAGAVATGVLIEDNDCTRPIEWRGESQFEVTVKNCLELKQGRQVVIRRNRFSHNWPPDQPGWALVFTPRNNAELADVTFEDNEVWNVSAGLNIAGSAYEGEHAYVPPFRGLTVRRNLFVISRALMGGSGRFCQIGGIETDELSDYLFEENTIVHDGAALFMLYRGSYDDPAGVTQPGKPIYGFTFRRNLARCGPASGTNYSFFTETGWTIPDAIPGGIVAQNVLANCRSDQRPLLPDNTFIGEAEFQAVFADYAAGDYALRTDAYPGVGRR